MERRDVEMLANVQGISDVAAYDMMMVCLPEDRVRAIKSAAVRAVFRHPSAFFPHSAPQSVHQSPRPVLRLAE